MKIENQVCSLEQAKKLKEIGINQRFANYFWDESDKQLYRCIDGSASDICCFAAFTSAELGELLPDLLETHLQYELVCIKEDDCWLCRYVRNNDLTDCHPKQIGVGSDTEAKARAAILISIIENELITPEDCNERLQD